MAFRYNRKNIACLAIIMVCILLPTIYYLSFCAYIISQKMGILPRTNQQAPEKKQIYIEDDPCEGRYIYIHDLPSTFNHDLVKNCHNLSHQYDYCTYLQNDGFGPRLNKKNWYVTNQFMVSVIFHKRMKMYKCLTNSSLIASAIYAPFFPGLETIQFLSGEFNESIRDAAALEFSKWLRTKPEWTRMLGRDHFFVAGRITWDFRRPCKTSTNKFWGSNLFKLPEVENMTVLTIESNPDAVNDIAIPYPTHFHPSSDLEVVEWQEYVRTATERRYLFAFGGAPRPNYTTSIRGELISQCKDSVNNSCKLLNCLQNDNICNNPMNSIKIFMDSKFCLQPPGDSYTGRSTFDSILAGCIPVFFHPLSAYSQYLWHFPKDYTRYSVFIPMEGIKNGSVNVGELLSKISDNDVSKMRENVIRLIPRTTYAQNKLETIEDALDVAITRVLERIKLRKLVEGFQHGINVPLN